MTTINAMVNALTSSDFSSSDVQNAIVAAIQLCEAVTDISFTENGGDYTITDKAHQSIVTMLTVDILVNSRNIVKSRNENVTVRSNQEIFDERYRERLIIPPIENSANITYNNMFGTNTNPTSSWEVTE